MINNDKMAYKQKSSPFHNAYSNPNAVNIKFADAKIDLDYAGLNANGVASGSDDPVPLKASDLENEGGKDYPNLQRRMKNAKNANKRQKIEGKINKRTIKDAGKATRKDLRQNVKEAQISKTQTDKIKKTFSNQDTRLRRKVNNKKISDQTVNPYDPKTQKKQYDIYAGHAQSIKTRDAVLGTEESRTDPFKKSPTQMKTPLNYLNPNTLEVQGDAGQSQDPTQQTPQPNRAGRPLNSNVLMNDPTSYQDPSKMSAQQNNQAQMFSGLASSAGAPNPEPMIPGQDPNQSITPGQQSPFNQNGGPGDPPKKTDPPKKMFGSETLYKENKSYNDAVKAYDDSTARNDSLMKNNFDEYLKSKTPTYPKMSDHFHAISKDDEKSPMKKKNWIQDVNKDIERRGTKGVCTGDKFGSESCPPGSKRYNLAKTFKKMNK